MSGSLSERVGQALEEYGPRGAQERFERLSWLSLLDTTGPDLLSRAARPAHLTASAAVLSPDGGSTCLVLHHKIKKWVQPGGHFELDDESSITAAAREVEEETGLRGRVRPVPVLLSRHLAPCAPDVDWHLDVQHLLVADPVPPRPSDESPEVAWWPVGALPDNLADGVELLILRAVDTLAAV